MEEIIKLNEILNIQGCNPEKVNETIGLLNYIKLYRLESLKVDLKQIIDLATKPNTLFLTSSVIKFIGDRKIYDKQIYEYLMQQKVKNYVQNMKNKKNDP